MERTIKARFSEGLIEPLEGTIEKSSRRVLRLFQSLFRLSGAFAFSLCSAVKFKDLAISLENSTVPFGEVRN
jgi:hypothetical protein